MFSHFLVVHTISKMWGRSSVSLLLFGAFVWISFLLSSVVSQSKTIDIYEYDKDLKGFKVIPIPVKDDCIALQPDKIYQSNQGFHHEGQCKQDITVYEILDKQLNGYFIDLASNEYKFISNTYALEKYANWSGLCIEPNMQYTTGIAQNRRCKLIRNPVYSQSGEIVKFKYSKFESGIVGNDMDNQKESRGDHELITVTLMEILSYFHSPKIINFLSLDVEGAEFHVLKHFDFGSYTIQIITIERPTKELHHLLIKHKFWFATSMRKKNYEFFGECLYLHESIPNFKKYMDLYRVQDKNEIVTDWNGVDHKFLLHPDYPDTRQHTVPTPLEINN